MDTVEESVKKNGKVLIVTEEPTQNSFAQSLAGQIQQSCFTYLDAPVSVIGSKQVPGIPLNSDLEAHYLPNAEKVRAKVDEVLRW